VIVLHSNDVNTHTHIVYGIYIYIYTREMQGQEITFILSDDRGSWNKHQAIYSLELGTLTSYQAVHFLHIQNSEITSNATSQHTGSCNHTRQDPLRRSRFLKPYMPSILWTRTLYSYQIFIYTLHLFCFSYMGRSLIYVYIYREREGDVIYIHIYIYIYTYIHEEYLYIGCGIAQVGWDVVTCVLLSTHSVLNGPMHDHVA